MTENGLKKMCLKINQVVQPLANVHLARNDLKQALKIILNIKHETVQMHNFK